MQTIAENILNVTLLEPKQKHPTIFIKFDQLAKGESLTLFNDHDPKPLYDQLLGERGNIFSWEYLEEGPDWWKVRISKHVKGVMEETLGQIAAKDLRKAQVFKKYGLDFCCGGKKTVKDACIEKGLDVVTIEQELQRADTLPSSRPIPYTDWSLEFLADYIVYTHHSYIKKTLPDIVAFSEKVMQVHGNHHPELVRIHQLVDEINEELTNHLLKEENILFPYIKALDSAKDNKLPLQSVPFRTVQSPISVMEMEHELVGSNLEEIRQLSNNYLLPQDACASYSLLYRMLNEFEDDLHLHIHLENNILFPKALEAENKLN